jgi:hypothetical protein
VTAESVDNGSQHVSSSASAAVCEAGSTFTADGSSEGAVKLDLNASTVTAQKPVADKDVNDAKLLRVDAASSDVVESSSNAANSSKVADVVAPAVAAVLPVCEADSKLTSTDVPEMTGGNKPIVRRTSIKTMPQTIPPAVLAAVGSSTTAAAAGGSVEGNIDVPPVHRPAPSLHAHTAVLEMLTKQHDNSASTTTPTTVDKPKARPPPVMKKPTKPQTSDVVRPH